MAARTRSDHILRPRLGGPRVRYADTLDRNLLDPVDRVGLRNAGRFLSGSAQVLSEEERPQEISSYGHGRLTKFIKKGAGEARLQRSEKVPTHRLSFPAQTKRLMWSSTRYAMPFFWSAHCSSDREGGPQLLERAAG
jgi:hypothetical protein